MTMSYKEKVATREADLDVWPDGGGWQIQYVRFEDQRGGWTDWDGKSWGIWESAIDEVLKMFASGYAVKARLQSRQLAIEINHDTDRSLAETITMRIF